MPADPLGLVATTIADKYLIEACVGIGGYAAVYRATHLTWKRPVAVKVFSIAAQLPVEARGALLAELVKEASLLAELSERNATICQARDVGTLTTADGQFYPYLVLEWLDGKPLDHVLREERYLSLPPRAFIDAFVLLTPVAQALMLAHRRGIAHRDVKPANIFIMGDPRGAHDVKLLDFGIAKVVRDVENAKDAFARTQGNRGGYTPTYASPEQFSRTFGATGPWTDVYALALLLTELTSNTPPLQGDNLNELAFASTDKTRRPSPKSRGVAVPDAVEAVMLRALAVEAGERFQDVAEFWNALSGALGQRVLSVSKTLPVAPSYPGTVRAGTAVQSAGGPAPTLGSRSTPLPNATTTLPEHSSRAPWIVLPLVLLVVVGAAAAFFALRLRAKPGGLDAAAVSAGGAATALASTSSSAGATGLTCPSDMVLVPAGKFFMGTDDKDALSFEKPAHQVSLGAYCIDRTEVTAAAYKACSDVGACRRALSSNDWDGLGDKERKVFDPLCNVDDPDRANHPMNCVDWKSARAFCKVQKKRLPTEAEWEHAARGSDGRRYPWGEELPTKERLNACGAECVLWSKTAGLALRPMYDGDDGFATTAPVGSFPLGRTVYGAEDMTGNVWEWVYDVYAPYGAAPETDPRGPGKGDERVIRGGAWNGSDPGFVRPTFRNYDASQKRAYNIGFRCAKSGGEEG